MKKINEKVAFLGQGWFLVESKWGGGSFSSYEGVMGKVVLAINGAMLFSAVIAVAMIIYGGYLMIISAGDAEKVEKGTSAITNGIIGMIIVFLAAVAVRFLTNELLS